MMRRGLDIRGTVFQDYSWALEQPGVARSFQRFQPDEQGGGGTHERGQGRRRQIQWSANTCMKHNK